MNTVIAFNPYTDPKNAFELLCAVISVDGANTYRVISLTSALPLRVGDKPAAADHCGLMGDASLAHAADLTQRKQLIEKGFMPRQLADDRALYLNNYLRTLGQSGGDPMPSDAFVPAVDPLSPIPRQAIHVTPRPVAFC